ncbi:alpha/beta fold hydrolase [Cupriavidus taiwanensis]|uniref:Alpha/beta hydrolase n=1 Tax=Cupriavidus taiwanensis (strain DSM 17343 / BCRC 17206 / CCUG 44338 / CIP 107171 / LMG 19424 / R1) TaxID=977880 RepID=B3R2M8_CUPTR|nr:alpha/beta hydrolase [Cupriavidus taiwanensis]CAQ69746.1 putative Alpha/beta hydrolase [Cupriavidus taiwanensis LMG 19424]
MDASDPLPASPAAPPFEVHPACDALPGWREAGQGRPLLLLHGWSVNGAAFDGQRALALAGFRVIAPDHAGHGLSRHRAGATVAALARDVAALIGHLGLADVVVAGWSMGALVAWALLRDQPQLPLAAIGSIDMTPRMATGPGWPHGLHGHYDMAHARQMAGRVRADWPRLAPSVASGLWAAGTCPDAAATQRIAHMAQQCDAAALASLWEDMARQDFRDTLRGARLPLFHLYGEASRLYAPSVGIATHDLQPAAGFSVVAGSGHSPHMEQAQAFNAALLALVRNADQASMR